MDLKIEQLQDKNLLLQRNINNLTGDNTVLQGNVGNLSNENLVLSNKVEELSTAVDNLQSSEKEIQDLVEKLISGPSAYICEKCVALCQEIIQKKPISHEMKILKPKEIKTIAPCLSNVS